ncbi:putative bifunctional diguanylate cyclase/phosphodiesterase [Ancylobacter terrae]|uniref:putative bifunctional diguanylate cyclase/phosphodiesterase n=1 Tax=Ancylobacter sp. sgz301288 TaxID=3342077 RepID=UPI00385B5B5F
MIVTFLTVALTALWMASRHDEQAAQATQTMVGGGLDTARHRLEALTNDYAWWEEAFEAYGRGDREWIDANVGTGITGTGIADGLAIVSPAGTIDYGWAANEEGGKVEDMVTPALLGQVVALTRDAPIDRLAARTTFSRNADGVMIVGAARVTPVSRADTVDPATLPLLVMVQYLNEQRIGELGASFLIPDLHLVDKPEADSDSLVIKDASNRPIAALSWTPPRPGQRLLRQAFLPLSAALLVFSIMMLVIVARARTMAVALSLSEKRAIAAARRDPLTELTNRVGFGELLASPACREAARSGALAVVYLDINGFKAVNDSIGHHGGDELIRAVTARFRSVVPANAHLSRVGGDEFAILLYGPAAADVAHVAGAVAASMERAFTVAGMEFHVTCAIGYAVATDADQDPDELIRQADMAMYRAKSASLREPLAFDPSMETGSLEKKRFEDRLRRALHEGELSVVYQPIVRASDLSVAGLEALIRWHSPTHGSVSPAELIAVAEETGLIREIGDFVVRRICEDLPRWPTLRIAVNVSPLQLRDPDYVPNFVALLERGGARPDQIEVELTEGVLIGDPASAARKLAELRAMGVTISLDDFGTGFSSIGYLRTFPIDRVKIDRSFTQDIGRDPEATTMIHALVSLSDSMKLSVVVEGVETEEQLRLLRLSSCEFVQGFYVHRPASADVIAEFIRHAAAVAPDTDPVGPQPDTWSARRA